MGTSSWGAVAPASIACTLGAAWAFRRPRARSRPASATYSAWVRMLTVLPTCMLALVSHRVITPRPSSVIMTSSTTTSTAPRSG